MNSLNIVVDVENNEDECKQTNKKSPNVKVVTYFLDNSEGLFVNSKEGDLDNNLNPSNSKIDKDITFSDDEDDTHVSKTTVLTMDKFGNLDENDLKMNEEPTNDNTIKLTKDDNSIESNPNVADKYDMISTDKVSSNEDVGYDQKLAMDNSIDKNPNIATSNNEFSPSKDVTYNSKTIVLTMDKFGNVDEHNFKTNEEKTFINNNFRVKKYYFPKLNMDLIEKDIKVDSKIVKNVTFTNKAFSNVKDATHVLEKPFDSKTLNKKAFKINEKFTFYDEISRNKKFVLKKPIVDNSIEHDAFKFGNLYESKYFKKFDDNILPNEVFKNALRGVPINTPPVSLFKSILQKIQKSFQDSVYELKSIFGTKMTWFIIIWTFFLIGSLLYYFVF